MNAPVTYIPNIFASKAEADSYFAILRGPSMPWQRRENPSGGFVPRAECYFNDTPAPYLYGKGEGARTYLPEPDWDPVVRLVRYKVEYAIGVDLDVCFLNMYETNRDYLGWHADDSPEMSDDHPIVTVSLGAERAIQFRPKYGDSDNLSHVETLMLGHGSAAIMAPGMQDLWQHRIPKSPNNQIGPRVSLTFRRYVDPAEALLELMNRGAS
jgi:alkylated DNA repair dioxygenase AlkB